MPILNWLTRDEDIRAASKVPYRLLEEVPELGGGDRSMPNMLIQGDNLEALKSLLPFYAGQVKCIYIDPPYNTGSAVEHYDDALEHSRWLAMMWPRLELLRELLSVDGSIWVSIDDREGHYLKVLMDEVFGRSNFVANCVWEKSDSPRMDAKYVSSRHDNTLLYAKNLSAFSLSRLGVSEEDIPDHFNRVDEYGVRYYTKPLRAMGKEDRREDRPSMYFAMEAPDGTKIYPKRRDGSDGRWRWGGEKVNSEKHRIDWVNGANGWVPYYKIFADQMTGKPLESIMFHGEVGSNRTAKLELNALFPEDKSFETPKPEGLLKRILEVSTNPGDVVLDSFLGSGTTAAVALKMRRTVIGVEMGSHAETLCKSRMDKVIAGEKGGVSDSLGWTGGGGFRFYRLGATVFDENGQIQPGISFAPLAAHIWFSETHTPIQQPRKLSPFLGIHQRVGYALLYNGILGDKRPDGGNVLTRSTLAMIREAAGDFDGPLVIYGERVAFGAASLAREQITFKQTPYDVKARR